MYSVYATRNKEKRLAKSFETKTMAQIYIQYFEQFNEENGYKNIRLTIERV